MPTYPPSYTQPPTPPNDTLQTGDAFDTAADNWNEWQVTNGTELPALALNTYNNAVEAAQSASTANSAVTTTESARDAAQASASNAATSETNAANSASSSATSETNASNSASNAATSETNAASSASSASTSETNAASSASSASNSASNASTSEANAASSETNAATSETNAANSASAAATSEANAASSETNAASSAANASTSEANAASSETNAASSETNAASSAANAASSETNAASSAANAASSETNAASSAANAANSEANAANSEAASLASANFIGDWTGKTGAYTVPTSTLHNGLFWMLLNDVANISLSEPSESNSDWAELTFGDSALRAVASGSISDGSVVFLLEDGSVSAVPQSGYSLSVTSTFNSGSASYNDTILLDTNKIAIAYRDNANSGYGTLVIGDVVNDVLVFGVEHVFNSSDVSFPVLDKLSSTKIAVAFSDDGNGGKGTVMIANISGTDATFGSEILFKDNLVQRLGIVALDADTIAIAYQNYLEGRDGELVVGDVSDLSVTFGSAYVFEAGDMNSVDLKKLDTDVIALAFSDATSGTGRTAVATISGTSATFGTTETFRPASTSFISVEIVSTDKYLIAYQGGSNYPTINVVNVNGTLVTSGSDFLVAPHSSAYTKISGIDGSYFQVTYTDYAIGSRKFYISEGTIDGNDLSFGEEYLINANQTLSADSAYLGGGETALVYDDSSGTGDGLARVIKIIKETQNVIGVASTTAADGQIASVSKLGDINDSLTGLLINQRYYVDNVSPYQLTTTDTGISIGRAVASDKLLITGGI